MAVTNKPSTTEYPRDIENRLILESVDAPGRLERFRGFALDMAKAAVETYDVRGPTDKQLRGFYCATLTKYWKEFRPFQDDDADKVETVVFDMEALAENEEKTCSMQESIRWTLRHLHETGIPKEIAPSGEAYNMHKWASKDMMNNTDFMKSFVVKLAPNPRDIVDDERRERRSDPLVEKVQDQIAVIMAIDDVGPKTPEEEA